MLLYIIRHGDPDYANDCLTEKGKKQAEALGKRLSIQGFDEIYSSPMGRARQTAEPTCRLLGIDAVIENWMSEDMAWNDFSVVNEDGIRGWSFHCQNTELLKDFNSSNAAWYDLDVFSGCSKAKSGYNRISQASDDYLRRLGYMREGNIYKILNPSEKRVAAFCHQGFGTTWLSHVLSVPPHIFWAGFDITHSGISILEFKNNPDGYTAPKCLCMSDTSHIYKENLPLQYNNTIDI